MIGAIRAFIRHRGGATGIEYSLIAGLVSLGIAAAGPRISSGFFSRIDGISQALSTVPRDDATASPTQSRRFVN